MLKIQNNSRKQGDVGLGAAISYFTCKGITVCIPLTDNQDYDLVIDEKGLKKVQVKTTYCKAPSGYYIASLKTCGGNKTGQKIKKFDNEKVDYLFVLCEDNNCYLIPSENIKSKSAITLNKNCLKFLVVKSC